MFKISVFPLLILLMAISFKMNATEKEEQDPALLISATVERYSVLNHGLGWLRVADRDCDDVLDAAHALFAYFGAGHDQNTPGKYKNNIKRLLFLMKTAQRENGSFGESTDLWRDAFCSAVLSEDYAMTMDKNIHEAAQRALAWIIQQQNRNGYWEINGRAGEIDLGVNMLCIMALKAGKSAGIKIKDNEIDLSEQAWGSAKIWVKGFAEKHVNGVPRCFNVESGVKSGDATDETALSLTYFGMRKGEVLLDALVERVAAHSYHTKGNMDPWQTFMQEFVLSQYSGEEWTKWKLTTRHRVCDLQNKTDGSWPMGLNKTSLIQNTAQFCFTKAVYERWGDRSKYPESAVDCAVCGQLRQAKAE